MGGRPVSERARRIAVVAHCHLDVNTKVHGLADYAGARRDLIERLLASDVGLIQLPCPEATFLGMSRWGMTYEQYDTPAYRRHCRDILRPTVDTLAALTGDGCDVVAVYGVEGSPSCGVTETCRGYIAGGEIEGMASGDREIPRAQRTAGAGVFFEELAAMLGAAGLELRLEGVR
jgi:predicted secreted protein